MSPKAAGFGRDYLGRANTLRNQVSVGSLSRSVFAMILAIGGCLLLVTTTGLPALDFSSLYLPGEKFRLTERADLRRYENGRFIGLSYRETRGVLEVRPGEQPGQPRISGDYYVFEETKHQAHHVAKKIDQVVPVSFTLAADGSYRVAPDAAYPTLRSFPVFPAEPVEPGDSWRAYGVRVVEPLRDGQHTRVRFYCEYRYAGHQVRNGVDYEVIQAQYAMRYRQGEDPYGDGRIQRISGRHVVTIYYDPTRRKPAFMSDQMEEQYQMAGDRSVAFKGFILTWFDLIAPLNRARVAQEVRKELDRAGVQDVQVEEKAEGVALTLNKIHFVADQAVVLPEERPRLQALADALKKIQSRSFLVVGHTARVGSEESQYTLSVERAKVIVDYLVQAGLDPDRFLYEGRGGTQPVAPNDTEENMAKNRRVEIVILED